jgi:hypothetical protein
LNRYITADAARRQAAANQARRARIEDDGAVDRFQRAAVVDNSTSDGSPAARLMSR